MFGDGGAYGEELKKVREKAPFLNPISQL